MSGYQLKNILNKNAAWFLSYKFSVRQSNENSKSVNKEHVSVYVNWKRILTYDSRSSQCSTTGVSKAVVCAILSVGWCI